MATLTSRGVPEDFQPSDGSHLNMLFCFLEMSRKPTFFKDPSLLKLKTIVFSFTGHLLTLLSFFYD
jgi:hypothetical protein